MHRFSSDFYGHEMRAIVLGYIRPELDYTSRGAYRCWFPDGDQPFTRSPSSFLLSSIISLTLTITPRVFYFSEDLIEDIETDKRVALKSLVRPAYQQFVHDKHFQLAPVHNIPTQ